MRAGRDGCGGSTLHPVHLRLDGQTEGSAAYDGGLSRVRRIHPRGRVRSARGGHLLGDGGCGLGDRSQLCRLRSPRKRSDHGHVRGRTELSRLQPILAGRGQASRHPLLLLAHGHSLAHARGRGARGGDLPQDAASARIGRRADQSGGLGVVSPSGRRRPLPDRRHVVANRDRRHPDQPASRRAPT